jgi:hypothetical protein
MVDWFYTADRLRRDGLMLLDDIQMRSVSVLVDFMHSDSGWEFCQEFSGKTAMFRKTKDRVLDVAWHMQPWTVIAPSAAANGFLRRTVAKLRHHLA